MNENIHTNENPLLYQVGGDHYKKYEYQPIEFFNDVHLDFNRANAIKYLTRWQDKGGVEDLKKALQYLKFAQQEFDKREEAFERFLDQFSGIERAAIQSIWLENYETAESDIEALI